MKVTRFRNGYRINLSDAEMSALRWIVADGITSWEGQEDYELQTTWTPGEKAAFTRRVNRKGGDAYAFLETDDDRRDQG